MSQTVAALKILANSVTSALSQTVASPEIIAKPDDDGESRIIDIDITINLDIKAYIDEKIVNVETQNKAIDYGEI